MYNLSTVIRFEVLRALKKKSFWVMALGFPIMFAAIAGIIVMSNKATDDASKDIEKQKFSFAVTDQSGVVSPAIVSAMTGTLTSPDADKTHYINQVKSGSLDGYIYYPKNLQSEQIKVYGKNVDIFTNGRYTGVAQNILTLSASTTVNDNVKAVLSGGLNMNFTAYLGGNEYDAIKRMVLPGIFLVLFYFLIAFFGNQMLTSSTEEKENRVIEMLLTTIEPRTLIIGKILSLIFLALIQGIVIMVPVIIGYLLFHDKLQMPMIDLSSLPVDWGRIVIGFMIFTASFLLFTGLLFAIGAAVPTAKEAGGFFGMVMMLIFGPLYAASLFVSSPESPFVQAMSFFPFTAPIPLMLRNAIGNLSYSHAIIAIIILFATSALVMYVAVRIFRFGALEYSRRLSLKEIFARR